MCCYVLLLHSVDNEIRHIALILHIPTTSNVDCKFKLRLLLPTTVLPCSLNFDFLSALIWFTENTYRLRSNIDTTTLLLWLDFYLYFILQILKEKYASKLPIHTKNFDTCFAEYAFKLFKYPISVCHFTNLFLNQNTVHLFEINRFLENTTGRFTPVCWLFERSEKHCLL